MVSRNKKERNKKDEREGIRTFIQGMIMGFADIIPGVSGGTMALIMGIYKRLIFAISSINLVFFSKFFSELKNRNWNGVRESINLIDFKFLFPLALGVSFAFLIGSNIILHLWENIPVFLFSFFFGLILVSAFVIYNRIEKKNWVVILAGLIGLFFAVLLTGHGQGYLFALNIEDSLAETSAGTNNNIKNKTIECGGIIKEKLNQGTLPKEVKKRFVENGFVLPSGIKVKKEGKKRWGIVNKRKLYIIEEAEGKLKIYGQQSLGLGHDPFIIFFSGFVAICAMILPGISGSFLLLFLGQYYYMLNALTNLYFVDLGLFMIGSVVSLLTFSRVLSYVLKKYYKETMGFLTGLMIGALRIPLEKIVFFSPVEDWSLLFGVFVVFSGVLGVGTIVLLEIVHRKPRKD